MESESRFRREVAVASLSVLLTVGAAIAITLGVLSQRLRGSVPFLAVWAVAAIYSAVVRGVKEARVRAALTTVPFGVHLQTPRWILLSVAVYVVGIGARVAAIATALVSGTSGVWVLAIALALAVPIYRATLRFGVTAVEFESAGLRAYIEGAQIFVRWTDIEKVERVKVSADGAIVRLQLNDKEAVLGTLHPDTPRTRQRLRTLTLDGQARLMLSAWLGGLPSRAMESAIKAAMDPRPRRD